MWVPISISVVAIAISGWSAFLSTRNSEVTRRLSKLDFRPSFRLASLLKSVGNTPPHWELTNTGPVEAVQTRVQMISHRFFPQTKTIQVSVSASWDTTTTPKIIPQETKSYEFRKGWLDINARLNDPPQCNIMEILLTYRRPQDLKEYSESAYYFVDPNGFWVHEGSSSLKGEPYESMRTALFKVYRGPHSVYTEWDGDPLHSNE